MRPLLLAFFLAASCGATAQPPRGPAYDPVNSPEAPTACPEERKQAQAAREELLEGERLEQRAPTAEAVLKQADCERQTFAEIPLEAPTQELMLQRLREARDVYQSVTNLYEEVVRYDTELAGPAGARLGDTHAAFAAKVRQAPPPSELTDPAARADFVTELMQLAAELDDRAVMAYAAALDHAPRIAPKPAWVSTTCEQLRALDSAMFTATAACNR